jgi:hypothetical protein
MTKKPEPKPMSELRRKRLEEIERSGVRKLTAQEREALHRGLDKDPDIDKRLAEANAAAAAFFKGATKTSDVRRSGGSSRKPLPR